MRTRNAILLFSLLAAAPLSALPGCASSEGTGSKGSDPAQGNTDDDPSSPAGSKGSKGSNSGTPGDDDSTGGPLDPLSAAEVFGKSLAADVPVVGLEDMVQSPDPYLTKTIESSGVVRANCTKKGCWMEVRPSADVQGAALTVRFKNYGFFVPLDSRGHQVRFQGTVGVQTMTPEQVRDAESEGATVPNKQPDGSAKVVTFIATGVEMRGRI